MKKTKKNLLIVAGIASAMLGIVGAVPSFLKEMYGLAVASAGLMVLGLVLLAIGFGD